MDQLEHYRLQFYQEALDILDAANDDLLKAEADPTNEELLNSIFRGIHTIKGSAGTFDLNELSEFAHHLEALLSALRDKKVVLSSAITDAILRGFDILAAMIEGYKTNKPLIPDKQIINEITSCLPPVTDCGLSNQKQPLLEKTGEIAIELDDALRVHKKGGLSIYRIACNYTDEQYTNGYDQNIFLTNLKSICSYYSAQTDIAKLKDISEFNPLSLYLHPVITVATALSREEIYELAFDPSLISVEEISSGKDLGDSKNFIIIDNADTNIIDEFIISSKEGLSALELATLRLEKEFSQSVLNDIFRTVHNIKGDANYVGLSDLVPFVHDLESLLEGLKNGVLKQTDRTTDIIFSSIDGLKKIIDEISSGAKKIAVPNIYRVIHEYLLQLKNSDNKDEQMQLTSVRKSFIEQAKQYRDIFSYYMKMDLKSEKVHKIIQRALIGLRSASTYVKCETLQTLANRALQEYKNNDMSVFPESLKEINSFVTGMTDDKKRIGEILVEEGKIRTEDVEEALSLQRSVGQILIEQGKVSSEDIESAVRKQNLMEIGRQIRSDVEEKQSEIRTMRVEEGKVERLANLLGEMVIARNTYEYLINHIINQDAALSDKLKPLKENLHLFSRITNEMQSGIMSIRMIPIKTIFMKFQRVARDIGRKQNKEIELIIHGEETEVDKKVADMLSEPLVHMVRNSCDHGIESRVQRLKAGKPEKGTVILNAMQEGRNIIIKIIDDGQGLDRNKIYEKATKMGLNPCSAQDNQIFQYIFHPGLSTKTEVSEISGRGVGMDVVRSTIRKLNGDINIMSEEGKGTEITLTLPMAIGITTALTVVSGGQQYAIPFDYVLETIKVSSNALHRLKGNTIFHYRGKVVPVNYLSRLMGNKSEIEKIDNGDCYNLNTKEIPMVMIKTSLGIFGVIVDKLQRNMEIAIKPAPSQLLHIQEISGVSIMGDGKVLLVVNPENLLVASGGVDVLKN